MSRKIIQVGIVVLILLVAGYGGYRLNNYLYKTYAVINNNPNSALKINDEELKVLVSEFIGKNLTDDENKTEKLKKLKIIFSPKYEITRYGWGLDINKGVVHYTKMNWNNGWLEVVIYSNVEEIHQGNPDVRSRGLSKYIFRRLGIAAGLNDQELTSIRQKLNDIGEPIIFYEE